MAGLERNLFLLVMRTQPHKEGMITPVGCKLKKVLLKKLHASFIIVSYQDSYSGEKNSSTNVYLQYKYIFEPLKLCEATVLNFVFL